MTTRVHLHAPAAVRKGVRWTRCADCKRRSPMAALYFAWYGPLMTCLRCGRGYSDGEWMPLPSARYARRDNIVAAKRAWRDTVAAPEDGDA